MLDCARVLAVKQPGHRSEIDMRMRPHVHPRAQIELRRAELVDEHERPDHPALHARHRAAHGEGAEIVADGGDGFENAHRSSSSS